MSTLSLPDGFFGNHWRKWPLRLHGWAPVFLPEPPSRADILAAIADGRPAQSDGATVWFLEGLTSGFPGFAELVGQSRQLFEWHDIWCDVFVTRGPSSIGCHYDGSDNFSIQLGGSKKWFLSPPDNIHPDDRRRRLLGEPGLGPAPVPDRVLTFSVRPGDVLYIPSTWVHWGLSDGDSTSVSLVINVAAALHVLEAQIIDSLRHDERWSAPLPVGPGSAAARDALLRSLVRNDLAAAVYRDVARRLPDREGSRLAPKLLGPVAGAPAVHPPGAPAVQPPAVQPPEVPAARPREAPPASGTPEAADPLAGIAGDAPPDLGELLARALGALPGRNLARLLRQCELRAAQTSSTDARRVYGALSACLGSLAPGVLSEMLLSPEVCSWLRAAEQDLAALSKRRAEDPLAHELGLALLPELAGFSSRCGPVTVTVPADEDGGLTLRRMGLHLRCHDAPGRIVLAGLDGAPYYLGRDGAVPIGTPHQGAGQTAVLRRGEVEIRGLSRLAPGGAVVSTTVTGWLGRLCGPGTLGAPLPSAVAERRAGLVAGAANLDGPCAHDRFLSWVLLRGPAADGQQPRLPEAGLRGLAVVTQDDPAGIALALAAARAGHEFDALADLSPVAATGTTAAQRAGVRASLRASYVSARVAGPVAHGTGQGPGAQVPAGVGGPGPAHAGIDGALLTAWGRALQSRIADDGSGTGSRARAVSR